MGNSLRECAGSRDRRSDMMRNVAEPATKMPSKRKGLGPFVGGRVGRGEDIVVVVVVNSVLVERKRLP